MTGSKSGYSNQFYTKMEQLYDYMIKSVESGDISPNDYKELIQKFVVIDEINLKVFTALKLKNPIRFVESRLKVLKQELSSL